MENTYENMTLAELRILAKQKQIKSPTTKSKGELIELLQEADVLAVPKPAEPPVPEKAEDRAPERNSPSRMNQGGNTNAQNRRYVYQSQGRTNNSYSYGADRRNRDGARRDSSVAETPERERTVVSDLQVPAQESSEKNYPDISELDSGIEVSGILELVTDGNYGFIRSNRFSQGEADVYVAPSQIRKFNLRTGDVITGNTRIKTMQEKYSALLYLKSINGLSTSEVAKHRRFEELTPIFPDRRLRLERKGGEMAMRIVDLLSPIGRGQRGMIVSPPKAGKTTLLKDIAKSLLANNPDIRLIILLIDERPEEVTDIREAIIGDKVEVAASTFDETVGHHTKLAELVIEYAKRRVELGEDVVILLDSITRLTRAYNIGAAPSGKTLSGGLDPASLYMPKRFFGAARNIREGGSLTILATALVETGSKMDDVIFEEFKGTGNMELVLDRKLSERRVFPAIDVQKSSTRREDLLLDPEEKDAVDSLRRSLTRQHPEEMIERILDLFANTKTNREFIEQWKKNMIL